MGLGLPIVEIYISHSDTPHVLGLCWTSDQPVGDTATWQHTTLSRVHVPGGIRTHNLSKRSAADPRLRPRGHRGRQLIRHYTIVFGCKI